MSDEKRQIQVQLKTYNVSLVCIKRKLNSHYGLPSAATQTLETRYRELSLRCRLLQARLEELNQ